MHAQYLSKSEMYVGSPGTGVTVMTTMWVPELEPGSSARAASALKEKPTPQPKHKEF